MKDFFDVLAFKVEKGDLRRGSKTNALDLDTYTGKQPRPVFLPSRQPEVVGEKLVKIPLDLAPGVYVVSVAASVPRETPATTSGSWSSRFPPWKFLAGLAGVPTAFDAQIGQVEADGETEHDQREVYSGRHESPLLELLVEGDRPRYPDEQHVDADGE